MNINAQDLDRFHELVRFVSGLDGIAAILLTLMLFVVLGTMLLPSSQDRDDMIKIGLVGLVVLAVFGAIGKLFGEVFEPVLAFGLALFCFCIPWHILMVVSLARSSRRRGI